MKDKRMKIRIVSKGSKKKASKIKKNQSSIEAYREWQIHNKVVCIGW
jgi:hypothetical protein